MKAENETKKREFYSAGLCLQLLPNLARSNNMSSTPIAINISYAMIFNQVSCEYVTPIIIVAVITEMIEIMLALPMQV